MKRKGKTSPKKGGEKKWFHPDLNRGPSLRQSDVITNYTMKPLNIRPQKGKIIVGEKKKKRSVEKREKVVSERGKKRENKKTLPVGLEPTTVRLRAARSTD